MHIKAQQGPWRALRMQLRTTEESEDKTAIVYTVVVALFAVLLIVVLAYFANRLTSPAGFLLARPIRLLLLNIARTTCRYALQL
jgi:Flp pilus assembly pilin Flp